MSVKKELRERILYQITISERGGSRRTSFVWASNREIACEAIMLYPGESIRLCEASAWWKWIYEMNQRDVLRVADQLIFFDTLETSCTFGLPLDRGLCRVFAKLSCPQALGVTAAIAHSMMRRGATLSQAMQESGGFPAELICMISSGEESGRLAEVLRLISRRLSARRALLRKILGGIAYPLLLLMLGIVAFFGLGTMVLPEVAQVFADAKYKLPQVTDWMLRISSACDSLWFWSVCFLLFAGVVIFLRRCWRSSRGIHILAKVPQLGAMVSGMLLLRPLQALLILLSSGRPLISSLLICSRVSRHDVYSRYFADIASGLAEGRTLEVLLLMYRKSIPEGTDLAMYISGVSDTGDLLEPLRKYVDNLEELLEVRSASLPKLLEPVLLSFVFVLILFVVVAAVLPGLEFLRQSIAEM
jgi:type II secretory pathway component PulF